MAAENKPPEPTATNSGMQQNKTPEPIRTSSGIQQNIAGLLCYLAWWITGIVFLIIEKENKIVRFHAWQSIFTFAAITIIQIILSFIPLVGLILGILVWIGSVILWAFLMYNAYQGKMIKLPITGNLAESQVNKTPQTPPQNLPPK